MINYHDLDCPFEKRGLKWRARSGDRGRHNVNIYVEAGEDREFYNQLLGPSLSRWITFRNPKEVGDGIGEGHSGATQAVKHFEDLGEEWLTPHLRQHCCLLDGEEAMTAGFDGYDGQDGLVIRSWLSDHAVPQIVAPIPRNDRTDTDYTKPDSPRSVTSPRSDGILFLNCHEMESLYFLYGKACELMLDSWGDARNLYGIKSLPRSEAWRCLHRTILIAMFNGIKAKYNPLCPDFSQLIGSLANQQNPLSNLPTRIENCIAAGLRGDIRETALNSMKAKLNGLSQNEEEVRSFSSYCLRICDGKNLLKHGFNQANLFKSHFKSDLRRNGFARDFQLSLVFNLTRQARFPEDPKEVIFGRGAYALTARSTSDFYS